MEEYKLNNNIIEKSYGEFIAEDEVNSYYRRKRRETANGQAQQNTVKLVWRSTFLLALIHVFAFRGLYLLFTWGIILPTFIWGWVFGLMSAIGTTAGAHRLWAHKSYRARLPLQIYLALCQTIACQNSIYEWVRDHRVHHKYTETDADPHNAKRGFFFAHCGWLMCRKHEDVKSKGKTIDMSDLESDPIVAFQKRHYIKLIALFAFILPTIIPMLHGETLYNALTGTLTRYVISLHCTWLVNSAAHLWGARPYDKNLNPAENIWVSVLAGGEGFHNYHHVYPYDYRTSEFGLYRFNVTALFIDVMAKLNLAYGLKTVPKKVVELRMKRTGDGSEFRH